MSEVQCYFVLFKNTILDMYTFIFSIYVYVHHLATRQIID